MLHGKCVKYTQAAGERYIVNMKKIYTSRQQNDILNISKLSPFNV